jgi:hypothetical protein
MRIIQKWMQMLYKSEVGITNATAYPTSSIQNVVKVAATDTLELYVYQS